MDRPVRILIIRPSALGDVCRSVSVLASLRAWAPDAQIDWMVRDEFADAIRAHPALNNVVPFPRKRFGRLWAPSVARDFISWSRQLRRNGYDFVIDCQGLARSGFFAWITGARTRLGFRDAREFGWVLLNRRARVSRSDHAVDRMLGLLRHVDIPLVRASRLYAPADAENPLPEPVQEGRYAVIAPGAIWPAKRWPASRFAELTQKMLEERLVDFAALVGAPTEREMCGDITALAAGDDRIVDLIGKTTIGELMRTIERAAIAVSNDSAAQHIAVGFDRPLVALMGPTGPEQGPFQRPTDVVRVAEPDETFKHKRSRADDRLMRRISVDLALEAVRDRLQSGTDSDAIQTDPMKGDERPAGDCP